MPKHHAPDCWYCKIPALTIAKLCLLSTHLYFDMSAQTVVVVHPHLLDEELRRQKALKAMTTAGKRWPLAAILPVSQTPIKYQWRLTDWKTMTEEDWNKVVSEIADLVSMYQYSFAP